jgi:hypothetical protein
VNAPGTGPDMGPETKPDIRARLDHPDAKVRRIALRDLLTAPPTSETLDHVASRLNAPPRATIEPAGIEPSAIEEAALSARVLGHWAHAPARAALESAIANPKTHALVAHECRIALDRIDLVALGKIAIPSRVP